MEVRSELDRMYIRELEIKVEELKRELDEMKQRSEKWREMYALAIGEKQ